MDACKLLVPVMLLGLILTVPDAAVATTPRLHETQRLALADPNSNDNFGFSVSLSGNTALVGACLDDVQASDGGSVPVFVREGETWRELQRLVASDGTAGDRFGRSVAIDGDTAVIGAWFDDARGFRAGSAYVFSFDGAAWIQIQKIAGRDTDDLDLFGASVAISGDTIVVGATGAGDEATPGSGVAYVFVRSGSVWIQEQRLVASDATSGVAFGVSVAISGDTVAVGAPIDSSLGPESGACYVFDRSNQAWAERQKLLASDGTQGDRFGASVALLEGTLLVGAPRSASARPRGGSAYRFTAAGGVFTEAQILVPCSGSPGDLFGFAVALSRDRAVVGATNQHEGDAATGPGAATVYDRATEPWSEAFRLVASDGAPGDAFGGSVAALDETVLVGAHLVDDPAPGAGAAYVFTGSPVPRSPIVNVGIHGDGLDIGDNAVLFASTEIQSGRDLNGDGDDDDTLLFLFDAGTRSLHDLGVMPPFGGVIVGDVAIFQASERDLDADSNGDGDRDDIVLERLDIPSLERSSLGLAVEVQSGPLRTGVRVLFEVSEFGEGRDLNGDGDTVDSILHAVRASDGRVDNLGLDRSLPRVGEELAVLTASEILEEEDLNGDGDQIDLVLHAYDPASGAVSNLGLAGAESFLLRVHRQVISSTFTESLVGEDLNADGDLGDSVVMAYDHARREVINTGLASFEYALQDPFLFIKVFELFQGQSDLNGDGDFLDSVLHVVDVRTGETVNLGLAAESFSVTEAGTVLFLVPESDQGNRDLNGDGDTSDRVAHVWDPVSRETRNLGVVLLLLSGEGDNSDIPVQLCETSEDLNGDRDVGDCVLHTYDGSTGKLVNHGLAVSGSVVVTENLIQFTVSERNQGNGDLNGDGDARDFVLHLLDTRTGEISNTRLAASPSVFAPRSDDLVAVPVEELRQGRDLTGDGDLGDTVLHVIDALPCSLATSLDPSPLLLLNGRTRKVRVGVGEPLELTLRSPDSAPARYILWVWSAGVENPVTFFSDDIGCTVNPTPLSPLLSPQPFAALRSPGIPGELTRGLRVLPGPASAPFTVSRPSRASHVGRFTIQGFVEDPSALSFTGFSRTNALVVTIEE